MDQKAQRTEQPMDVDSDATIAWKKLFANKNDEIENTFCHRLFELNYFDDHLFLEMCKDIDFVLKINGASKADYQLLVWIVSCTFRSVFSHYDEFDSYKITNFNGAVAEKWRNTYLEKLRGILENTFTTLVEQS